MMPMWQRHGLKTLCRAVGRELRKFEDVLTMEVPVEKPCMICVCLDQTCKRRSKSHFRVPTTKIVMEEQLQPLESVVPGHPLWPALVEYSVGMVAATERA